MGGVGGEEDFDSALVELRGKAVDGVVTLVFFGSFVDRTDDDGHLEAGNIVENWLRVGDVVEHEFQMEFVGQADGGLEIARAFGGEDNCLFAFEVWD